MAGSETSVSISDSTRKMIQNIKEITGGNYSEDEILACLHDYSMDPELTIHRLLLQDPYHGVKRKGDKGKENLSNKDTTEPRGRSSSQGRGTHDASHDVGGAKETGSKQVSQKASIDTSTSTSQKTKK